MKPIILALAACCVLVAAAGVQAQQQFPSFERGLQPEKLYHFAGIDNISVFNGNLTIVLPMGQTYPVDGGLTYQLKLSYNSNIWDFVASSQTDPNPYLRAYPAEMSNAGLGWLLGFGVFVAAGDPRSQSGVDAFVAADGGEHRFDSPRNTSTTKYTTDGTNLRLRTVSSSEVYVDFPDGTSQRHQKDGNLWELTEITGPRGAGKLTVAMESLLDGDRFRPLQCTGDSVAWWKMSDGTRDHYACFSTYEMDGDDRLLVDKVHLDGPDGPAVYEFRYDFIDGLPRLEEEFCHFGAHASGCPPEYHSVTVLQELILPDGSSWKFDTNDPHSADLKVVTLPTGGQIEYGYFLERDFPAATICSFHSSTSPMPILSFGSRLRGVGSRTVRKAVPAGAAPESYTWTYGRILEGGKSGGQCTGNDGKPVIVVPHVRDRMVTTVIDPTGAKNVSYFSVWPVDMIGDSPAGVKGAHYSLPYGTYDETQKRYLSQEQSQCSGTNCTRLRSKYVRHDVLASAGFNKVPVHRLESQAVFYHDDPAGCVATGAGTRCAAVTTELSEWDEYAHYRTTETSHTFGSGGKQTVVTDWNKPNGVQRVISPLQAWTLDEYENRTTEENGVTLREQVCFADMPFVSGRPPQRYLRARRMMAGPSPQAKDVITVFEMKPADGNLQYERRYGGDETPLPAGAATEQNLCAAITKLDAPAYELTHGWQHGVLATSQFTGAPFKSLDLTVDRTGLVSESRDSAGVVTKYFYDSSSRVSRIEPTGGAAVSYTYPRAAVNAAGALTSPAKAIETANSSTGAIERIYLFDSLGRIWREKQQMPGEDAWRLREITYDALGRQTSVSEWTALDPAANELTHQPPYATRFYNYDIFGRPALVVAPDGASSTFTYTGDRVKVTTTYVATPQSAAAATKTTEHYDAFGRLLKVIEPAGASSAEDPTGADVTAEYTYDPAGRLVTVELTGDGGVTQERAFDYDGRGFLMKEIHLENGDTDYQYDARGNMTRRTNGGTTLRFTYDKAGRLTDVATSTGTPIKAFRFGASNSGQNERNKAQGKLVTATRHNHLPQTGRIDVTETYSYEGPGGLLSKKKTLVERVAGTTRNSIQEFEYEVPSYDDLMLPQTVRLPRCLLHGCSTEDGIGSITYRRSAAYLTSVEGFGSLTYHPSGMLETVRHESRQKATDTYSARFDMARPSKITFQGCTNTRPYFLPGAFTIKPESNSCGLLVSWPAAAVCGGAGNVKFHLYRDDEKIASCLSGQTTSYLDRSAQTGKTYTYRIVAEGPQSGAGTGSCNAGELSEPRTASLEFKSCAAETILEIHPVLAHVGAVTKFEARLSSPNGALADEKLLFNILGNQTLVRTGPDGRAIVNRIIDVPPAVQTYSVSYAGGVVPAKTVTAGLNVVCGFFSYAVNPMFIHVRKDAAQQTVHVNSSTNCTWLPQLDWDAFFTVAPETEQRAEGTFDVRIPEMTEGERRESGVVAGFHRVRVRQSNSCTYRFSPPDAYLPARGDASFIDIVAPAGCTWTVSKDVPWIHFQGAISGTGNGRVGFRFEGNLEGPRRVGHLIIDGTERAVANINQEGAPPATCPSLLADLTGGGTVSNGQYVSLRVWASGSPLTYRWFANNSLFLECSDCDALLLAPGEGGYPDPNSTTEYQVEVTNGCGSVYTSKVSWRNSGANACKVPELFDNLLRTNDSPIDLVSPQGGTEILVDVGARQPGGASGTLQYQWYRGFAPDTRIPIGDGTAVLKVSPNSTEFFWVEVSNGCGTQISRTARILVTQPVRTKRRAVGKDMTFDGRTDLLWKRKDTAQVELWEMAGSFYQRTWQVATAPSLDAELQATGDFDGDERPDIVWRNPKTGKNEVWIMSGWVVRETVTLEDRPDPAWTIGAVNDFDGDGNHDVIWHNEQTGQNEIWFQNGTQHVGTWALPSNPSPSWGLYGSDDFNADGRPDLYFYDRATGDNSIWIMNDERRDTEASRSISTNAVLPKLSAQAVTLPNQTDLDLVPALVADMSFDNRADIVWRNKVTGELSLWTLKNGTELDEIKPPFTARDLTWDLGAGGSANNPLTGGGGGGTPPGGSATSLTVNAQAASAGSVAVVTATLTSGTAPVAEREVVFALNGSDVTRALTDEAGAVTAAIPVGTLGPGTYANAIAVKFLGDATYGASSASTDLVINAAAAKVQWNNPAPIVYGTPLSVSQLNATADVAGTFVYDPPAGTVLAAGAHTLSVTFTPTDPNRAPVTATVVQQVTPAPSSVSWARPAAITYGTPLSALQQNATSTLAGEFAYDPPAGTILPVGAGQTLKVTLQPSDPNYAASTASTTIDVTKGGQVIHWSDPAPISTTTPLGPAQLNATVITSGSAPAGAMTYNPPAGTILGAGVHELRVTVAATDRYEAAEASVDIVVRQETVAVQWPAPAPIVYGTPLTETQLNATAAIPGTFTYTPPAGTFPDAGTRQLYVLFTPADSRYEPASATVTIEVSKARQSITWSTPAAIVYGTPLSAAQLNATVQVIGPAPAGTLVYSPEPNTILQAGTQTLAVVAKATDNYEAATASVAIDVLRADPVITWPQPAPIIYKTLLGDAQLNATANVPGTFVYTPPAGTLLQAGSNTLSAQFTPADSRNYNPATASVTLEVQRATPVLTWTRPAPIIYKTLLGAAQLNATADVPGAFEYTPPAGTLLQAGTHTLSAQFTPADARNYNNASATTTLEVQRATPVITWTTPAGIVYGTPLGAAQLDATADVDGTFRYTPPAGTILDAGPGQTLAVHFTPDDTRNYNDASATTTIDVAKAKQTIVWATPSPIVYGTPLSSTQLDARIDVVGPAPAGAVTYTPAAGTILDAGTHPLSLAVAETKNYEPAQSSVTLQVSRAPLSLVVDAKSKPYGAPLPELTGVLTGVQNNDPIAPAYATTATRQSPAGTYPISGTLDDPTARLVNYDVTIKASTLTVTPVPLLIAANPAGTQYSDPLPELTATFTGFVLGETPAVLAGLLSIQTTATPVSAPGTYPITIGGLSSSNYVITYAGSVLTVTPEDARVVITSPALVSARSGPTTVTLSVTVRDISATADAGGDVHPGDIRKARLVFVDRATGQVLCEAAIGLIDPADERVGTATCSFSRDFGATLPAALVTGVRISDHYTRDAAGDDVTITIAAPTADSITGAGTINVASAAGSRAPDASSAARLQMNLQYDKNGSVQGKLTFTFTRTEGGTGRQYELTAAVGSLAIVRTAGGGTAAIVGNATLRDVTVPNAPVVVVEGAPMFVTATDNGEPSTNDAFSITVLRGDGGLWLATGWNGDRAVEQKLLGGNLAVHYAKK